MLKGLFGGGFVAVFKKKARGQWDCLFIFPILDEDPLLFLRNQNKQPPVIEYSSDWPADRHVTPTTSTPIEKSKKTAENKTKIRTVPAGEQEEQSSSLPGRRTKLRWQGEAGGIEGDVPRLRWSQVQRQTQRELQQQEQQQLGQKQRHSGTTTGRH